MNTETKACPMCGETIPADAKECKCCLEHFAINDESSGSGFRNIYSKVKINVSRLVNTSKITNETTNIYRFINRNEDVTLEEIKESFQIDLPDLEVFLSRLIEAGFIYKYESGDEIVYSTKEPSKNIGQKHKFETCISSEVSTTKQGQDKLQKSSTEGTDIKELTEPDTQEVNAKPDQASIHDFYSSINDTSNIDDLKLTQTSTTNIDGEINGSKSKHQDTKLIIEIYTFIKSKESVALKNITRAYNMYNIDVRGVLNSLLKASLIYKYDFVDGVIFSINPDLKDHQAQSSDADTSKEIPDTGTSRDDDIEPIDYETNIRKIIYAFVEKHANVTDLEIANFFDKEPTHVKGILRKLIESGDVCKHDPADTSDNATYSTNTTSATHTSQDQP